VVLLDRRLEVVVVCIKISYLEPDHDVKIGNRCFENVEQFRCFVTTITNRNLIQEEIKRGFLFYYYY
jgi:hypothetical protein